MLSCGCRKTTPKKIDLKERVEERKMCGIGMAYHSVHSGIVCGIE